MTIQPVNKKKQRESEVKFGTFLGVFTPSVLTILGLVMYLRFGWVVGNTGLALSLLIVLLSSAITFITALSASAIATNMKVGVGGEYYMIAHSLGPEWGGAIGIPLFLCRTLSITFYSYGLSESILSIWPQPFDLNHPFTLQILAAGIILFITTVSGRSAGLALKLQIPIMFAVGLSLIALASGVWSGGIRSPEWVPSYRTAPQGFWYVFAVFFPAVTGFTAGIGLSGDLKDPQRSIPRGTLLAVLTGTLIYVSILILLSLSAAISTEELAKPEIVWTKIALFGPWLVFGGVWGAILSSAFGSILGGPRVLQALARDKLAPKLFARLSKKGQPTTATWASGAIALAAIALGELNTVAQFVTILFLTLYVIINLSAAIEQLVGDPSYRPRIHVPWYVSLAASLGAVVVMFLINPWFCFIAIVLELLLYAYLQKRSMQVRWGDVRAGFWIAGARFALLKLAKSTMNQRNWRPQILLFAGDPNKRIELIRLANWFNQDRGLVTVYKLLEGDFEKANIKELNASRAEMEKVLDQENLVAFSEVHMVPNYLKGVIDIAQAHGFAGLRSNTVMFGWTGKKDRLTNLLRIMRTVSKTGKSMLIAHVQWTKKPGPETRIDIWWRGLKKNGDLMLLFAHLFRQNPEWKNATIHVRCVVEQEKGYNTMSESMCNLLPITRIPVEMEVLVKPEGKTIMDVIHETSRDADIVFMGLMEPEPGKEEESAERLIRLAEGLNTTVFVHNAGEFAGRLL